MKTPVLALLITLVALAAAGIVIYRMALAGPPQAPTSRPDGTLWDQRTRTLAGEPLDLAEFRGKVVLVVNTASKCGLTPQYEGLQALHEEFAGQGLVVLGVPSNDFMGQEPGTPEEIRSFCDVNYKVTFPLTEKAKVKGPEKSPLYTFLTAGGLEEPTWNFTKYLVGRDGVVIARFAPRTTPQDAGLREALLAALDQAVPGDH